MNKVWVFLLLSVASGCGIITWPESVETGFEDFSSVQNSLWVEIGGQSVVCAGTIDSVAFEGQYSLLAAQRETIAFTFPIIAPKPDGKYLVEVWCRSAGRSNDAQIEALLCDKRGQRSLGTASEPAGNQQGWQRRELLVQLPPNHEADSLLIVLKNNGDEPVWFDDFRLDFLDKVYYPDFSYEETIQIRINEPDIERLREKRRKAFDMGYLDMDKDDWVRCEVQLADTVLSGSLTLKGDDLKNLEGDKWSMKIQLDEGTLMGMRYFAVINPELRSFLDEWLFHEMLNSEQLVAPHYGFMGVSLNGRSLGVYAFEERILDESFVHRDTVNAIARFEDLGWAKRQIAPAVDAGISSDPLMEADIEIEREDDFDKPLRKKFKAQIEQFRSVAPGVAGAFNTEKAARMLALCDVLNAYHALHWTNIRFVSDRSTAKVELVGNDAFNTNAPPSFGPGAFMAFSAEQEVEEPVRWKAMYLNLFNDKSFLEAYLNALDRYASKQYLDITKLNTFGELKHYQSMLLEEWPAYRFSFSRSYSRARQIQKDVADFREHLQQGEVSYRYSGEQIEQ